jgi:hypothetical protein
LIIKGKGWRIGWKESAPVYQGLIGGEDWAIELTNQEMRDFLRLLLQIDQAITDISEHLMEEETIACEVESDLIWLGAQGYFDRYSLRIILLQGRGCEGTWDESVIQEVIQASQSLDFF